METKVKIIVDRYRLREQGTWSVKPEVEAAQLKALVTVMDPTPQLVAIVHEADVSAQRAYQAQGYTVHTMNGDRPQVLPDMLLAGTSPPSYKTLVIVSDDSAFTPLIEAATRAEIPVQLWTTQKDISLSSDSPMVTVRKLTELFPTALMQAEATASVWVDLENVLFGLVEQGREPDVVRLLDVIKALSGATIQACHAYGDFACLREALGYDVQRVLEENGVHTVYQVNRRGKNSADMRMVTEIQATQLNDDAPTTVVLVSGDRDFGPLIEVLHAHGKRVVVLACRSTLSRELQQQADAVYTLDEHFERRVPVQSETTYADKVYLLKVLAYLKRQGWKWLYVHKLPETLNTPVLERALSLGTLLREGDRLRPNYGHPLTRAAACAVWWLPDRLRYLLERKAMPYVDTKYLARGMALDPACRDAGLGQTYEDAQTWLNAAAEAGVITRAVIPHPNTPERRITTWRPLLRTQSNP